MIIFIISLFFIIAIIIILQPPENQKEIVYIILGLVFILTAGLFQEGVSKDYYSYLHAYDITSKIGDTRLEPTFTIITIVVKNIFNNPVYLFLIYSILGVSFKFIAIKKLSELYLLSALLYISHFFLLHEMTQIRVGIASGLFLLSIKPLYERNFRNYFFLTIIAFAFHYSALVLLPLWFLSPKKQNVHLYLTFILLTYLLVIFGITIGSLIEHIPLKQIQVLYNMHIYEMEQGIGDNINIFNTLQIIRTLICLSLIYNVDLISSKNKYAPILIKIYSIGLMSFLLFSDFPVVSFRISELLLSVEIIIIPFLLYLFKPTYLARLIPIGIGAILLYINLFYTKLLL